MAQSRSRTGSMKVPARCNWSDLGSFATDYGAKALGYLRKRTQADPWFAFASGVMHAGQIDYNRQQPVVEKVVTAGPEAVMSYADTAKMVKGAQDYARIVAALPLSAACYRRYCGPDGRACMATHGKMSKGAEDATECLRSHEEVLSDDDVATLKRLRQVDEGGSGERPDRPGLTVFETLLKTKRLHFKNGRWVKVGANIGPKVRNMMAEYLGCPTGVAVDRHVGNWLTNSVGRVAWVQKVTVTKRDAIGRRRKVTLTRPIRFVKAESDARRMRAQGVPALSGTALSSAPTFALFKKTLIDMAGECGIEPAALQVGAWAQGVCDGEPGARKRPPSGIWLGEGQSDSCSTVPRIETVLSGWAMPIKPNDRPKGGKPRFECKPGYLGASGTAVPLPGAIPVLPGGPLRPPAGESWSYSYSGKPMPVRILSKRQVLRAGSGVSVQPLAPLVKGQQPIVMAGARRK